MTKSSTARRIAMGGLVGAVLWAAPMGTYGQTIRGRLMEFGSDQPIDLGLVVMISEAGDSVEATLSSADGFFEIGAPQGGNYFLEAAALGYRETRVGLFELGEGGVLTVEFRLWPAPLTIDGVMVASLVSEPALVRNGFYRRMQRGVGSFFTPEALQAAVSLRTLDVLQGLPGVRTVLDPVGGERILIRGTSGYCQPAILVDGVRATWAGTDSGLDDLVPFETLLAMEVHLGVTGIPIEFGAFNSCGVIVFWTKPGRGARR